MASTVAADRAPTGPWLVSAPWDVAVFGGSALAAFALLLFGRQAGIADGPAPPWLFLVAVVGVDVAHVWATAFRVYLDPAERARRPGLYAGIPVAAYVVCLLYTSPSPRDRTRSRMPSSA